MTTSNRIYSAAAVIGLCLAVNLAEAVRVKVPDSLRFNNVGDTMVVPICIINHGGQGIVAVDLAVEFSSDTLRGTRRYLYGNAAPQDSNWNVMTNFFPCSLLVALASTSPLIRVAQADSVRDTLLYVKMVAEVGSVLAWGPIRFLRCRLNEGQVACTVEVPPPQGLQEEDRSLRQREPPCLFPNPARAEVLLDGSAPVDLVSPAGQLVAVLRPGANDVSRLPRGVYFIREERRATREYGGSRARQKVVLLE